MEVITRKWMKDRVALGFEQKSLSLLGYHADSTDGLTVGTRSDGMLVRLSSEVAATRALSLLSFADSVTRVDLQVTLFHQDPLVDWGKRAHVQAARDPRIQGLSTELRAISTLGEGQTTYIGSRSSERFFRVYDKHAETEGVYPKGTWRWEVEYKGSRAASVAARLQTEKNYAEAVRSIVVTAFKNYRVEVPCLPVPRGWTDTGYRERTNDERRILWLEKTIGPAVRKLLERQDPAIILKALGLESYYPPDEPPSAEEEAS